MAKPQAKRQWIRKTLTLVMFLLFPITINFFSPYIIIDGASRGIVNGSLVVFGLLFLSSLFLGRLWCSWACPGAGLQEACFSINSKPARGGRFDWIKWGIWIPWIGIIAAMAILAGGYRTVDLLYLTESGISVDEPVKYALYYTVVGIVVALSLTAGRRSFCHYGCWMAPFMIAGRSVRNALKLPALRLKADAEKCAGCKKCTSNCPMSLDVHGMVKRGIMENSECILCGTCIDGCPKGVISYSFSK